MDAMFFNGKLLPPGHPMCRCAVAYEEINPQGENSPAGRSPGAGNGYEGRSGVPDHGPPEYPGFIDDTSEDVVESLLKKYEDVIVNSSIEHAIVITRNGEVWHCNWTETNVYPNEDPGEEKLRGSWVVHNHPIEKTHFSFSPDDISLFMDFSLKELSGVDEFYRYTIRRTDQTTYADRDIILIHAFKEENYAEFLDADLDGYDFFVKRLAKQYGFEYRREKQK